MNTVAVLGLGRSGMAACRLLLSEGDRVVVLDSRSSSQLESKASVLRAAGAEVHLGCEAIPRIDFAYAVISPGLAEESPLRRAAVSRGIRILSELELGWSRIDVPTIALTGSNGKSSAVKLIAESLRNAGLSVCLGGNYGTPASELALKDEKCDWLVLEVSSFQLETVSHFRAEVAVLLNILPNHLDRHEDMNEYTKLKTSIFSESLSADHCILPFGLSETVAQIPRKPLWTTFANRHPADWVYSAGWVGRYGESGDVWHRGDFHAWVESAERKFDISGTYFDNDVLGPAAAAAMAVCDAAGIDQKHVVSAARDFLPLPHRMQRVGQVDGVAFIDDSKATNVAAMLAGIRMSPRPLRLIAGGLGKGEDFGQAKDVLSQCVDKVYLIGDAALEIDNSWRSAVPCEICEDLKKAVVTAFCDASPGDAVLLSPACASFDQFVSFEERGESFIKHINNLAGAADI